MKNKKIKRILILDIYFILIIIIIFKMGNKIGLDVDDRGLKMIIIHNS